MEKLNHRIWCCDLMENRELLSVKRNQHGDILFELDGGLTRQFTPHSEVKDFTLERVHVLGRGQDSKTKQLVMIASLVLKDPKEAFSGNLRDIQTAQGATNKPSKGKKKPRLEVSRIDAAKICFVSESTIKKWDAGKNKPEGYPGRFDLVALGMWQQTRASKRLARKVLDEKNMIGEAAIDPNQYKVWKAEHDAEIRSKDK